VLSLPTWDLVKYLGQSLVVYLVALAALLSAEAWAAPAIHDNQTKPQNPNSMQQQYPQEQLTPVLLAFIPTSHWVGPDRARHL
jgi:hypothetical protein